MSEKLNTPLRVLHNSLTNVIEQTKKLDDFGATELIIVRTLESVLDSIEKSGMKYERAVLLNVFVDSINNDIEGFERYYNNNFVPNHDLTDKHPNDALQN
jgi:enamine deaminase RidA (YjgF/YER057c/UK114 family)